MRKVLPTTLILLLAAFGCTMNRTPGEGQPSATPSVSPAATPGSSYGNVPMASSYTVPTTSTRLAADEAAAIMREHQAYNGRVLGYLNPAPVIRQQGQQLEAGQSSLYASNTSQLTPVSTSAPATVIPRTVVAPTSYGTLPPTVIPASTPNGSPITISNSDGQIVVSNVKNR